MASLPFLPALGPLHVSFPLPRFLSLFFPCLAASHPLGLSSEISCTERLPWLLHLRSATELFSTAVRVSLTALTTTRRGRVNILAWLFVFCVLPTRVQTPCRCSIPAFGSIGALYSAGAPYMLVDCILAESGGSKSVSLTLGFTFGFHVPY